MVRNQLGLKRRPGGDGLKSELDMLSEPMREAVLAACAAYAALGVPFALVGGLAAGALGRPRFRSTSTSYSARKRSRSAV